MDIDRYFNVIFNGTTGLIEVRRIIPDSDRAECTFFANTDKAAPYCLRHCEAENVYVGMATRKERGNGTRDNLCQVSALWVDQDFDQFKGGEEEARRTLEAFPLPPSMIVQSGFGFHPYWLLHEPVEANPHMEGYLRGLAAALGGDAVWDLSRILRPPDTFNHPNAKKRAAGREKAPVTLESLTGRRYSLADFEEFWQEPPEMASPVKLGTIPTELPPHFLDLLNRDAKLKATWEERREDLKDQSRSGVCMSLANQLVLEDFSNEEIAAVLLAKRPESTHDWLGRTIGKARENCGHRAWVVEDVLDFIERQTGQREPLIEGGLLPTKSIAFISGTAKQGKSVLALNMAINLASGTPFLGQFHVPIVRKVLYINAEIAEESLRERLKIMLAGNGPHPRKGHLLHLSRRDIKLDNRDHIARFGRLVERYRPDVVILDPLSKFHSADENSASEMMRLLSGLDTLVQEYGISLVIVHHHGKPNPESRRRGAQLMRGSSTMFDYGDGYITMTHWKSEGGSSLAKLTFELRNAQPIPPLVVCRDNETLWYTVEAEISHGSAKLTPTDVVNVLKASGGEMMRQDLITTVGDRLGVSDRTVERAIEEAGKRGVVQAVKVGGRGNPVKLVYKGTI
ncbi:AAA family ATPase [Nitrospinae bacterium AH_259_B05_G02_I21]|nr:AAA family ATPase [Nitrospinae bacterium AH_259_B05_G02_I21]